MNYFIGSKFFFYFWINAKPIREIKCTRKLFDVMSNQIGYYNGIILIDCYIIDNQ